MSPTDATLGHRIPWLRLWVDGEEVSADVVSSLRVEERVDRASTLTLVIASSPLGGPAAGDDSGGEGDWDTLLRGAQAAEVGMPGMALLSRVTVGFALRAGPASEGPADEQVVFDGFVTGLEHRYAESRASDSELVVEGMDASYLMHVETVTRRWDDRADHEVATDIYRKYGFAVEVSDTPRRSVAVGSMQQRCTDAEFLRMLARRNGFEAFVSPAMAAEPAPGPSPGEAVIGRFRHPPVGATLLPTASLFPDTAPTLVDLTARCDVQHPATARGWHVDEQRMLLRAAEVIDPGHEPGVDTGPLRSRRQVVDDRLAAILGDTPVTASIDVHSSDVPHDDAELTAMTLSRHRDDDWFATADATVAASRYEAVVRAGTTIPVVGAGPIFDGSWYVRAATHRWGADRQLEDDPPQYLIGTSAEQVNFTYEVDVELARTGLGGQP